MFLELASITRIAGSDGRGSLVGYNDIGHLAALSDGETSHPHL
jgi:hypothetical protein